MIIGFTGRKFSGKDTAADILKEYGYIHKSFAGIFKVWCVEVLTRYGYSDLEAFEYIHGSKKEEIIPEVGKSAREMMQTLGTEWGRNFYDNLWVDITLLPLSRKPNVNFVISDVRFPNECRRIQELGGSVYRLVRPGNVENEFSNHPSETLVDTLAVDYEIANDGSIEDLREKLSYFSNKGR